MGEMKHTPGPWECKDHPTAPFDGEFRILGPFFSSHITGQSFDDRHWIAYCKKYEDALLIAAAPTLAAALQDCVAVLSGADLNKSALTAALINARAALSKLRA